MGQRGEAALGCLAPVVGAALGAGVWWRLAQGRVRRFEAAADPWVLVELPVCLLGGVVVGVFGWAAARAVVRRRRGARDGYGG
ncbi:hypothetical protein [Streptomyces sp. SID11385]|uniref:hypothetical protein n=1 Tax=Streptomyces sp. SID11385 TaxID=2706031 RepID=UPI0013C64179|nr:hypothetical protein [Streptomyces sp. SID11385]NEA38425.1 hypothetical protein [Streptomyces sp. SID11385]